MSDYKDYNAIRNLDRDQYNAIRNLDRDQYARLQADWIRQSPEVKASNLEWRAIHQETQALFAKCQRTRFEAVLAWLWCSR